MSQQLIAFDPREPLYTTVTSPTAPVAQDAINANFAELYGTPYANYSRYPNNAFTGTLFDPLSSLTGWSTSTGAVGSITTDTLSNGLAGINFTYNAGETGQISMDKTGTFSIPYDPDTVIGMWVQFSNVETANNISILLSNDASDTFTNWNFLGYSPNDFGTTYNHGISNGLCWISCPIADASVGGGSFAAAGNIQSLRVRIAGTYNNQGGTIKISQLFIGKRSRPKLVIAFDDGWASQYTQAYRYMSKYGLVGTIAVPSSLIGGSSYCTLAQLQEMYAAGWLMVNHTVDHTPFNSGYGPTNICLAQTPAGAGNLSLNGSVGSAVFNTARNLVVIAASDQGRKLTITGLDANSSPLTEIVYTATGSAPVPTVNTFTQVTSIAIDAAATGTIEVGQTYSYAEMYAQITGCTSYLVTNGMPKGAYHFVFPQGETNSQAVLALQNAGMLTARLVGGTPQYPGVGDYRNLGLAGYGGGGSGVTTAFLNGWRGNFELGGGCGILYLHDIVTSGTLSGLQVLSSTFQAYIDACVQDAIDQKINLVTQDALYGS